jgi:hypothetical protein
MQPQENGKEINGVDPTVSPVMGDATSKPVSATFGTSDDRANVINNVLNLVSTGRGVSV